MKLILYPNKLLETKCAPVTTFDEELGKLLDEMKNIMTENKGIGLASNQVGFNKQIIVMKTLKGELYEFINPSIIDIGDKVALPEGCLSFPNVILTIERPSKVAFQYQDRFGETKQAMAEGIEARIVLHEMEHLSGKVFINNVNHHKRKIAKAKLKKLRK